MISTIIRSTLNVPRQLFIPTRTKMMHIKFLRPLHNSLVLKSVSSGNMRKNNNPHYSDNLFETSNKQATEPINKPMTESLINPICELPQKRLFSSLVKLSNGEMFYDLNIRDFSPELLDYYYVPYETFAKVEHENIYQLLCYCANIRKNNISLDFVIGNVKKYIRLEYIEQDIREYIAKNVIYSMAQATKSTTMNVCIKLQQDCLHLIFGTHPILKELQVVSKN